VDVAQRAKISEFHVKGFRMHDAVFSSDGLEIFSSSGSATHFWSYDLTTGNLKKIVPDYMRSRDSIKVSSSFNLVNLEHACVYFSTLYLVMVFNRKLLSLRGMMCY